MVKYKFVAALMIIYSDIGCILMNNTHVRILPPHKLPVVIFVGVVLMSDKDEGVACHRGKCGMCY